MYKQDIILNLRQIHCEHSSPETGRDEIYLKIYEYKNGSPNPTLVDEHFKDNPIEMKGTDKYEDAYIDFSLDLKHFH